MGENKKILKPIKKGIEIKVDKDFKPKEFFKSGNGLYVWSGFQERIIPKAKSPLKAGEYTVDSFDLTENASDAKIESELPKKHVFTESQVCAIIAELIKKQPKGKKGALLNNSYVNLFYTKAFVVCVDWRGGAWGVGAWDRVGGAWGAGSRVFSPAN